MSPKCKDWLVLLKLCLLCNLYVLDIRTFFSNLEQIFLIRKIFNCSKNAVFHFTIFVYYDEFVAFDEKFDTSRFTYRRFLSTPFHEFFVITFEKSNITLRKLFVVRISIFDEV